MTRDDLARQIAEVALLRGEFTLRSGRKSSYYLDKYRFETQPRVLAALGTMLAAHAGADIDLIAGPELGAVALAAAAAMASGKPCLFVRSARKDYGSSRQIEGLFQPGERILLVEDIVTSGGQLVEACRTLEAAGLRVERTVAVIDRLEGGREAIEQAGYRFEALFTTRDLGIAAST